MSRHTPTQPFTGTSSRGRMNMRRIQVLPLAAVVVVLTACGTRIPHSEVIASVNQGYGQQGTGGDALGSTSGGAGPGSSPLPGGSTGVTGPSGATGPGG